MNTSSLQIMKMAGRHVCRVKPFEDENISYKASSKDGSSKNGGDW